MRLYMLLPKVKIYQNTSRTNLLFDKSGQVVRTENGHRLSFPTFLLKIFLILFVVAFASLFFNPNKDFAFASGPDPLTGMKSLWFDTFNGTVGQTVPQYNSLYYLTSGYYTSN